MANMKEQGDTFAHPESFHRDQLAIFDAYSTDELDADEKVQVEQYLQNCQECQHLFEEVTHLRHALGTLADTTIPEFALSHSHSIADTVLERIEQEEARMNQRTIERVRQKTVSFHAPGEYSPARLAQKRARSIYLSLGVAVCCVLLFGGLIIMLRNVAPVWNVAPGSNNRQISVPARMIWTTQQQPMLVQNAAGVFTLKEIEITMKKEFRFYYAFRVPHQGEMHATAVSSLGADQKQQPVTLATTVLPLGTIDGISVGVIRVQYLNRVDQTITLNITSPEEGGVHWQLSPLKQLLAEPHSEGGGFYGFSIDQHLFSEIIWSGPVSKPSDQSMASFFKNAAGTRYIFLEVDYAGKIVVITKERCVQLVDEQGCR